MIKITKHFKRKFRSIRYRCSPDNPFITAYSGRGIRCEWNNLKEFYGDMYKSYLVHLCKYGEKETTIDRIDNDKNYCKKNCRWATNEQQQKNRRKKKYFFDGKYKCMEEWLDLYKIKKVTFYKRLGNGWDFDKALTTPTIISKRHKIV